MKGINIESIPRILFWISVFVFLFLLGWRIFGESPTLEQISAAFIPVFFYLTLESRFTTAKTLRRLDNRTAEQTQILKEIRDYIKK